jgi:hypothetical protein
VYAANVLVAGWIGISSLFFPDTAARTVFQQAYPPGEAMRLVGCLWLAIAVLSGLGLWRPGPFAAVLVLQLVYKATWLLVVAGPASRAGQPYPTGMAAFFVVWVVVLPFVIPWRVLLAM